MNHLIDLSIFVFISIKAYTEFVVEGLKIVGIPNAHGDINCFGYKIGDILYMSDVNKIHDESR